MLHGHIVQLFLFLQSSSRYERMRFSGCWWWFATHCGSNWIISPRNKNVWKHKLDSRIMEGKKDQRVGNSIKAKVIQAVTFWSNHWKSLNHSKRGHKKNIPKRSLWITGGWKNRWHLSAPFASAHLPSPDSSRKVYVMLILVSIGWS